MILNSKRVLTPEQISNLRNQNKILPEEYAYIAGDLLVAENIKTSEKRVLGNASEVLQEGSKRILKG